MSKAPLGKRKRNNGVNGAAAAIEGPSEDIDFQRYWDDVNYILNEKYCRLSGSKQFEKGSAVAQQVQKCIKAIGKATTAHCSYGRKRGALAALIYIGSSIMESYGELAREVRKDFQYETCLEKTMLRIVKSMTARERSNLMTKGLGDDLAKLEKEADGYGVFGELKDVRLALPRGLKVPDKELGEDEEGDGESEGEEGDGTSEDEEEGGESEDEEGDGESEDEEDD